MRCFTRGLGEASKACAGTASMRRTNGELCQCFKVTGGRSDIQLSSRVRTLRCNTPRRETFPGRICGFSSTGRSRLKTPPSNLSSPPERSEVEGSAVLRIRPGNVFRPGVANCRGSGYGKAARFDVAADEGHSAFQARARAEDFRYPQRLQGSDVVSRNRPSQNHQNICGAPLF